MASGNCWANGEMTHWTGPDGHWACHPSILGAMGSRHKATKDGVSTHFWAHSHTIHIHRHTNGNLGKGGCWHSRAGVPGGDPTGAWGEHVNFIHMEPCQGLEHCYQSWEVPVLITGPPYHPQGLSHGPSSMIIFSKLCAALESHMSIEHINQTCLSTLFMRCIIFHFLKGTMNRAAVWSMDETSS